MPLTEQVYILGRATSQGETAPGYMFFYEPTVSRVHAELRWNEKKKSYFVHHQSKTNPTLVEGLPVDKKTPRPLEKGHKIQMGYLVLEVEPASEQGQVAVRNAPAAAPPKEDSSKTHKMMVGNILEALSNLSAERNPNAAPPAAAPAASRVEARPDLASRSRKLQPQEPTWSVTTAPATRRPMKFSSPSPRVRTRAKFSCSGSRSGSSVEPWVGTTPGGARAYCCRTTASPRKPPMSSGKVVTTLTACPSPTRQASPFACAECTRANPRTLP